MKIDKYFEYLYDTINSQPIIDDKVIVYKNKIFNSIEFVNGLKKSIGDTLKGEHVFVYANSEILSMCLNIDVDTYNIFNRKSIIKDLL